MDTVTAKFSVNTPLFMSGADQAKAEIRAPSIKGVIRFWWRALYYAEFKTLSALKEREEALFGSTRKQSSVRFAVEYRPNPLAIDNQKSNPEPSWLKTKKGCVYLGYGVINSKEQLERPCIRHNQYFILRLAAKDKIDPSIIDAVKLYGLIGGAGAKSRKGYGSVTLVEMQRNGKTIPCPGAQDLESYGTELKKLLCRTGNFSFPAGDSFTAFSTAARVDLLLSFDTNPIEILNNYGETMQLYRSWGRKAGGSHVLPTGEKAEHNFKNDHDWFKNENSFCSNNPDFHPERALFGLPHNYFKYDPNGNHLSANVEPAGDSIERRASPLFFHVHKLEKKYIGVSILLPALFLPGTERQISADGTPVDLVENNYRILTNFLEGKRGYRTAKTKEYYFPERKPIWPEKEEKQS